MTDLNQRPGDEPEAPRRGPGRPPKVREAIREDVRAEPIRDALARAPEGLSRRRKGNVDKFELPEETVKRFSAAGYTLEWKRHTIFNQEDPSYSVHLAENHWEPVTAGEVPGFMPSGYKGAIVRDGLQLMKRPAYLTEEARYEDVQAARDAIRIKEQQLGQTPPGTLTRDHQSARPKVARDYEPIRVPD